MLKYVLFVSLLLFFVVQVVTQGCPEGTPLVRCRRDPCEGQKCKGAKCRPNFCGGCNRLWYSTKNGFDVTLKCECKCSTFQCPSSTDCKPAEVHNCLVNPCRFAKCRKYPKAICCPSYCGGCKALWFLDGKRVKCNSRPRG